MVPVFLATRGNVYGALGGRISSGHHQGLIEPRFQRDERLVNAVVASFINGIGISIVIGVSTVVLGSYSDARTEIRDLPFQTFSRDFASASAPRRPSV